MRRGVDNVGRRLRRYKHNRGWMTHVAAAFSTLQLDVPNAAILLNAIATQYEKIDRIAMEYIDNSIDAGEEEWQKHREENEAEVKTGRRNPTQIHVDIDYGKRNIWIRDNGPGFDGDRLRRVVTSVGTSTKRQNNKLNGRFGFGMQCFRGAAKRMTVFTKEKRANDEDVNDDEMAMIALRVARETASLPGPFELRDTRAKNLRGLLEDATVRGIFDETKGRVLPPRHDGLSSGTAIVLESVDPMWFKGVSLANFVREIESHFEVLLGCPNVNIIVSECRERRRATQRGVGSPIEATTTAERRVSKSCDAFDYENVPGTKIRRTIETGDGTTLRVNLVVGPSVVPGRKVRVFQNGRRINELSQIRSFVQQSPSRGFLWDHAHVCGFVEIIGSAEILEPVLTRTDFTRNEAREKMYAALSGMENEIEDILNDALRAQADESLADLEDILAVALRGVERDRRRRDRGDASDIKDERLVQVRRERAVVDGVAYTPLESTSSARVTAKSTARKSTSVGGFGIQFVRAPQSYDATGNEGRASVEGENDFAPTPLRSFRTGTDTFCINIDHPHFTQRLRRDRAGRLVFDARLCAYLATEVATQYHTTRQRMDATASSTLPLPRVEDAGVVERSEGVASAESLFHALNDSANELEDRLFKKMSTLTRKLRKQRRFDGNASGRFDTTEPDEDAPLLTASEGLSS